MYRGTTPTIVLKVDTSLDLSDIESCWVTLKSGGGTREKDYPLSQLTIDTENNKISLTLSQEDTLYFKVENILIQVRLKLEGGYAYASNIVQTTMEKILKEGEI